MSRRPSARGAGAWLVLLVLLGATGCADPIGGEQSEPDAAQNPLGSETPDPARDALLDDVDELRALLARAHEHLAAAAASEDLDRSRNEAGQTLALLVGDPDGAIPLFPVERGARGAGSDREDLLTSMLTVTREAGGADGRAVRELLRDLVAGDLGAWQRDADGMLAIIEGTLAEVGDLDAAEEAIFSLPGEATRAVAWAQLVQSAGDAATARTYAERGATHLDIAVSAVDALDLRDPDDADDPAGDPT